MPTAHLLARQEAHIVMKRTLCSLATSIALLLIPIETVQAAEAGARRTSPVLIAESDPLETPEPTCSVCSIVTKAPGETRSTAILVTLIHGASFTGDVELRVWLDTEEWVTVWIPEVTIGADGTAEVEVEVEWDWDDMRLAWTTFYSMS